MQSKLLLFRFLLLLLIFYFIQSSFAQTIFKSEPVVRVLILKQQQINLKLNSSWQIRDENDSINLSDENGWILLSMENDSIKIKSKNEILHLSSDSLLFSAQSDTGTMTIKDVPYGVGWWWEGKEDRIYEGSITIHKDSLNNLLVVVKLPLERYLKGVVPYEIGNDSPAEALKAQAIAARSEAIMALASGLYNGNFYDLTSDVECQVYSGNKKRSKASDDAVDATRSFIISENNKPINAYYASNCGGCSELIKNVWPERQVSQTYMQALKDNSNRSGLYLTHEQDVRKWIFSKPDVYCNPFIETELPEWSRKNFRWQRTYSVEEISVMLSGGKDFGLLLDIVPKKRGPSGRMIHTRLLFKKDSIDVTGELAIRMLFKPALRSACFIVDKDSTQFILNGAGWGHGVGMCQSGAVAMAKKDFDYKTILQHYYPGTELVELYITN